MPNGEAPTAGAYKLGGKGGKVAQAWQFIWDRLDRTEYRDGTQLAEQAAVEFRILPQSIISHLHRMAKEGHLETEVRPVNTRVFRGGREFDSKRKRTHYRIKVADE
jgi:DNA-binding PadR family transcriptional regulator